jgi:hypothetical protein
MGWDAPDAVSEFIGSLVVFFTLVYLSVQTRQKTKSMKAQTF